MTGVQFLGVRCANLQPGKTKMNEFSDRQERQKASLTFAEPNFAIVRKCSAS